MKINPTEKSPHFPSQSVDNNKKNQGISGFDAVLQHSIQKSSAPKTCVETAIRGITSPLAPTGVGSAPPHSTVTAAQKLLDRLEDYQRMLADPGVTLKLMQPAVEQMEKQAVDSRSLISGIPEGHPLKNIIQDTMANITREIERFNTGYYVDD